MPGQKKYSVIIIGSGITGLSAAYHLRALKISDFVIIADQGRKAASLLGAGLISGGTADNFTRLHHTWGPEFAKEIWRFGDEGARLLKQFSDQHQLQVTLGNRYRFASNPLEVKEMETASRLLRDSGFDSEFLMTSPFGLGANSQNATATNLALQVERNEGAVVDPAHLLAATAAGAGNPPQIDGEVLSLATRPLGLTATLRSGQKIQSEMIVVATHLGIPALIPELAPAIVSFADQWHRVRYRRETFNAACAGSVFSYNHGFAWGSVLSETDAIIGGGRQLRKFAGYEATEAKISDKCTNWLGSTLQTLTGTTEKPEYIHSEALLDCRPCDEVPIIGPMFGENRILVATGYSGSGLAMGFHAGKCIADLVAKGTGPTLPLRFHPARLRSLAD